MAVVIIFRQQQLKLENGLLVFCNSSRSYIKRVMSLLISGETHRDPVIVLSDANSIICLHMHDELDEAGSRGSLKVD